MIDTHVHLRDPGQTHKEDFASGTAAALAGGFTLICAMPNTNPPITDEETLTLIEDIAETKAHCDYGLYLGATPENAQKIAKLAHRAAAEKMYLNETFTTLTMKNPDFWISHIENWPKNYGPLCVHAEENTLDKILIMALKRPLHICHVARKSELISIIKVKEMGFPVTCEVCPHHLILSQENSAFLGDKKSQVRPCLATEEDRKFLLENLRFIDTIGSDHAPHTLEEKLSQKAPPGLLEFNPFFTLFLRKYLLQDFPALKPLWC